MGKLVLMMGKLVLMMGKLGIVIIFGNQNHPRRCHRGTNSFGTGRKTNGAMHGNIATTIRNSKVLRSHH